MKGAFTITEMLAAGGIILILLLIASSVVAIIIIERYLYFYSVGKRGSVPLDLVDATTLADGEINPADRERAPHRYLLGKIAQEFAPGHNKPIDADLFEEVKGLAIAEVVPAMDRYLGILATLATISPFVGLLGTVLGIIRAFHSLGGDLQGVQSIAGLNQGISEALVTTAAGLVVAIPATAAYNYFRRKKDALILQLEIHASRVKLQLLRGVHR